MGGMQLPSSVIRALVTRGYELPRASISLKQHRINIASLQPQDRDTYYAVLEVTREIYYFAVMCV